MNTDLHESTLRNRRRAVSLFEEFIQLCLDDIEHKEVGENCRQLVKKLIKIKDEKENSRSSTGLAELLVQNYCRYEATNKSNDDDLVIVIDGWTRCLYSNIGFDGSERDYYKSTTIQTFRQNLQAWAKQTVGRHHATIIGEVFRASKTTLLKKKRKNDTEFTETRGKNEKRGFYPKEIDKLVQYLFDTENFGMLLVVNYFRHLCCRKSSLFSISLKNAGLLDFDTTKCCMNVRTEYAKGQGRMLSDKIVVFADRTDFRKCAIFSLAVGLMNIQPDLEISNDSNLLSIFFGKDEANIFDEFKDIFTELFGIEVADEIGFHSFRKYSATMLKSGFIGDKDGEKILNIRGGWAQEHSKEKGVQSIVSNSDVKSYYISYDETLDGKAGKILASGYSTMPHFNPFFEYVWQKIKLDRPLQKEIVKSLFPANIRKVVGTRRLIYFGIFAIIGYVKLQQPILEIFHNPKIAKLVDGLEKIPLDKPADFSQFTYESALRYGLIHEYRMVDGKLFKHDFNPPMICLDTDDDNENADCLSSSSDSSIAERSVEKEDIVILEEEEDEETNQSMPSVADITEAMKITKPTKKDIDMTLGDASIVEQKLQFTYDQVLKLWEHGKDNIPPMKEWDRAGILDMLKLENNALWSKCGNIKRQVENYYKLGGVKQVIAALEQKGKKPTLDNAKIKL